MAKRAALSFDRRRDSCRNTLGLAGYYAKGRSTEAVKLPLRTRDTAFLLVLLALVSALWLAVWGPWGNSPDDGAGIPGSSTATENQAEVPSVPPTQLVTPQVTPLAAPAEPPRERTSSNRTSGAIRGHISLSAKVVGDLKAVHVRVREAVNTLPGSSNDHVPHMQTIKEEIVPELGTPEFYYDGIPFSEYGYVVRVFAPGFNGSEQFVQLDEANPIADVTLSVTAGVTFTVLLRDQKTRAGRWKDRVPGPHR